MQTDLAAAFPVVEETYAEASEVLGFDLWELVTTGSEEALKQTAVTQPALLTAGVAAWRVWLEQNGAQPTLMAGHSLGEYSALVCAGVIKFADAVMLVRKRGEYMQEAVPAGEGAMAAILNLAPSTINELCESAANTGTVQVANYNSPVQTVVAGTAGAVEQLGKLAIEAGAKRVVPLPVSAPFHCQLMAPAAERMAELLVGIEFNKPEISVVNNVDVAVESDPAGIRSALVRQLYCPVQWTKTVEFLAAEGIDTIIEVGPGKVLTGLGKRIVKSVSYIAVYTPETVASWQAE
jgi:[acyl-carrier-protein] S-malonyltransferase